MTLTIHTQDFDHGKGLSGKVYLDPKSKEENSLGEDFGKDLSKALLKIAEGRYSLDEILFLYRDGEEQKFIRFAIKTQ